MPIKQPSPTTPTDEAWPGDSLPAWDQIDEASWESFPASDPPGYYTQRAVTAPVEAVMPPPHQPRPLLRIVLSGASLVAFGVLWLLRRRARG